MGTSVHQFHQSIRRSDAIGEEMLALRGILRSAGYDSEIFVGEAVPDDLKGDVRRLDEYRDDPTQLLLLHHSIGHHHAGLVSRFADAKVLVYHNITPPRFFVGNPFMQRFLERGRRQLRTLRPHLLGAFAASGYNASELRRAGYSRIEILPPVFALGRLLGGTAPIGPPAPGTRLLFVGRFAPSKRQDDVVEAFDNFASRYDPEARLSLVGAADPDDSFAQLVFRRIERSRYRDRIETPGVVSDRELARLYRQASVYLSMSEHEGFGVPLLESFHAGVPVVAFDSGAVAETMGGAGLLFSRKRMEEVASLVAEVVFDRAFRELILEGQRRRLQEPDIARAEENFLSGVEGWLRLRGERRSVSRSPTPLKIRIDGPFETSYGLAVVNRQLAQALADHGPHRIAIHCTEGPGDYLPRAGDLADKPDAARLWERSWSMSRPDVVIRNMYPPRFDRGSARLQLAFFYWEDSLLPPGWADRFNATYDGILAPTRFVRDVLRRSGVRIPIEIVAPVVRIERRFTHAQEEPPEVLRDRKGTCFLSVGSAFPRKGIDVLLRAYARAFSSEDDTLLVLKTFPNIHNTVARELEELRRTNRKAPRIVHIDRDISRSELFALYRRADAIVHPSRAEGFGLPVAEGMLLGVPIIAPSSTGLADFCTEETAFVIPHRWEPSRSHFETPGAEWAEPDESALAALLKDFAGGVLTEQAKRKAAAARELIAKRHSPRAVAEAAEAAIGRLFDDIARPSSVGFVSTWNAKCGIATYTHHLVSAFPDGAVDVSILSSTDFVPLEPDGGQVARVWVQASGDYRRIVNEALERELDIVHIQFHPGILTEYVELARTIHALCDRGVRVFVTVHVAADEVYFYCRRMILGDLVEAFSRCERLFVHNDRDFARLAELGLHDNLQRVSHGGLVFPERDRADLALELGLDGKRIVASFGFALPHKGVLEAIEAVALLRKEFPKLLFLALAARRPEKSSGEYLSLCRARIAELGLEESVLLLDQFLSEAEIGVLLSASELVVLPYLATKESVSGAIRYPLACGRATITTREPIFDDARKAVYQIASADPVAIADGICRLLLNDELRRKLEQKARRLAVKHSWERVAIEQRNSYRRLRRPLEIGSGSTAPAVGP
jgi:glycosyltransferase involved in cell wall biosynthesis